MKKLLTTLLMAFYAFGAQANDVVTLVVPVAPGGGTDVLARAIVENMTRQGIPMIISNKPGAERSIGANFVATANPDGKTLFLGAISDTVLLPLFKYPGLQFNEDTFVPVAFLATLPPVIVPAALTVPAVSTLVVATRLAAVEMLAVALIVPVALTLPPVAKFPPVTVPVTVNAFAVLLNSKPATAPAIPLSLKITCVLEPGAVKLP